MSVLKKLYYALIIITNTIHNTPISVKEAKAYKELGMIKLVNKQ